MPNWKEAFEETLAKGCRVASTPLGCYFCGVAQVDLAPFSASRCETICPLLAEGTGECGGYWKDIDSSLRRAIFRHVLKHTEDFTDRDEIRARIAEMLDDDAREKFLGKAETRYYGMEPGSYYGAIVGPPHQYFPPSTNADIWPDLHYIITERRGAHIAAFRDKKTRDRVLEFLNADAAEDERIDRLLIQLKELLAKG